MLKTSPMFDTLPTPTLLLDRDRVANNIKRMQQVCDAHGVHLWPHIKTHKTVEIARMQLDAGARGLVCAKIGEAEALLPSGVRRVFLAHSFVDPLQADRLRALADALDELIVAATSVPQALALEQVLARVDLHLPVLMAVDTGLGREGARGAKEASALADGVRQQPHLTLRGMYTHEGHAYRSPPDQIKCAASSVHEQLLILRDQIDPELTLWPGCSVTAAAMATLPGITVVRPGTYVLGDLGLARSTQVMGWEDLAVTVLTTVVDRPALDLALVDAGSKTLSSDKNNDRNASFFDGRDIHLSRLNEEHGYATGDQVDLLRVGERVRVVPAHICPVMNLADEVTVLRNGNVVDTWRIAARGKVR